MARYPRFIEFRVYAGEQDGRGLFVYARVYATKPEMLKALRADALATAGNGFSDHTDGAMQSFKRYKSNGRLVPCLGRVSLYQGRLGTEVVTHEFAHVAFAWAHRKRLVGRLHEMPNEEQVCYVLGRMARRFVSRAIKLGLYEAEC